MSRPFFTRSIEIMKYKAKAPWLVKAGESILVFSFPGQPEPRRAVVTRVSKGRGMFTGATVWRHHYRDPMTGSETWIMSHGIRRSHHPRIADWKAEKILVP
jgi:hypothetical protein